MHIFWVSTFVCACLYTILTPKMTPSAYCKGSLHRCVLALYTQYFPEFCENISQAYYLGGIWTHDPYVNSHYIGPHQTDSSSNALFVAATDPASELVRHFLIEPNPRGVRLKGCANEPIFGSLSALIYQHTLTQLALPCKLQLPETGKQKKWKIIYSASSIQRKLNVSALFSRTFNTVFKLSVILEQNG